MARRATARIKPVKVRHYDRDLHCDVSAVVGYRVECDCKWRSQTHQNVQAARIVLARHRETHLSTTGGTAA